MSYFPICFKRSLMILILFFPDHKDSGSDWRHQHQRGGAHTPGGDRNQDHPQVTALSPLTESEVKPLSQWGNIWRRFGATLHNICVFSAAREQQPGRFRRQDIAILVWAADVVAPPTLLPAGTPSSCWLQPACWAASRARRPWRGSRWRRSTSCSTTPSPQPRSFKINITSTWSSVLVCVLVPLLHRTLVCLVFYSLLHLVFQSRSNKVIVLFSVEWDAFWIKRQRNVSELVYIF